MTNYEVNEIIKRYERRAKGVDPSLYSYLEPSFLLSRQELQRKLLMLLGKNHIRDPSNLSLLEVGAGSGRNLLEFILMGFSPQNLTGIELLSSKASEAMLNLPSSVNILVGDASSASHIPLSSFDIVYQSLVFSSILDLNFQQTLAYKMWSWVRPGGAVLWYDFTFDNPRNQDVRRVTLKRIRELFPSAEIESLRVTLAPPLSRFVCNINPGFYPVFNALPALRTHLLCWIKKP